MNFEKYKEMLIQKYGIEKVSSLKKISTSEIFVWETSLNTSFPNELRNYLLELGTFLFDNSFYECLDNSEYHKFFIKKEFIEILLENGIAPYEIIDLDYNIKCDEIIYPHHSQEIYKILRNSISCFDIGIYLFNDTYNCVDLVMLTGENKNNIVEETSFFVNDFSFNSYKYKCSLYEYLLKNIS